jgi:hypothetical protein
VKEMMLASGVYTRSLGIKTHITAEFGDVVPSRHGHFEEFLVSQDEAGIIRSRDYFNTLIEQEMNKQIKAYTRSLGIKTHITAEFGDVVPSRHGPAEVLICFVNWRRRGKFDEVAFIFPNAPDIPITVVCEPHISG